MNNIHNSLDSAGLHFFGKVSASVSHDVKNALAVINENAGLLEDIVLMAEKGMPLNPERIKKVGVKIRERVSIADAIMKNLNTFAHSVDTPTSSVNIGENIELLTALSSRLAASKGIEVGFIHPDKPIIITTSPFFLTKLCWYCLETAINFADDSKHIDIVCKKIDKNIKIFFTNIKNLYNLTKFPEDLESIILNNLNAEILVDYDEKKIILSLPEAVRDI